MKNRSRVGDVVKSCAVSSATLKSKAHGSVATAILHQASKFSSNVEIKETKGRKEGKRKKKERDDGEGKGQTSIV
jgi:hypothetical protein